MIQANLGSGKSPLIEVKVLKKADDPKGVTRVSIGGGPEFGGWYCVYRGSKRAAIRAVADALDALREMDGEPEITPEDVKQVRDLKG